MSKPKKPMSTLLEHIEHIKAVHSSEAYGSLSRQRRISGITKEEIEEENKNELHRESYCDEYRRLVDFDSTNFIEKYPLTPFKDGPFAEFPPLIGVQFKLPPSANSMYTCKAGKQVKTKIYFDWLNEMWKRLGAEFHEHRVDWAQSVGVLIYTNLRRKSDIDNIQKGILDCLVKAEIFPDDNFVDLLKTVRCKIPDEGFFMLNISKPFENDKYWHE